MAMLFKCMRRRLLILLEKLPEETIRWEELFCIEKHSSYCRRDLVNNFFLQLEQYMLFMAINDLCSLAFEGAELNPFLHTPNKRQRLLEGNGTVGVARHIHSKV